MADQQEPRETVHPMFEPEFLEATRRLEEQWRKDFDKIAERFGVDPATYQAYTRSGLPIKPVYFPHDVAAIPYHEIGSPGLFPYTRGLLAAQYQFMPWANQPVMGYGLPEETRERMDFLRAQGMTGYFGKTFYNLVYDLVSHEGVDPDHPAARGRVGQCGMAVYCRRDMERLFDGLELTQMNVVHITGYETIPVFAHYLAYAQQRGVPWQKLLGNTMNWYYQSAYCGMTTFPPQAGVDLAVELIQFCNEQMPQWNTLNLFGYGMEEAGAVAVEEVAFSVAAGLDYARACMAQGLAPDDFLPRFGFQIAQANDFFEEIAKVRALRRLWAKTCQALGATKPSAMHVRIHTHTSGVELTAQQPLNNLVRTTLHALGAALAGTQAMEVSAYDEALSIPTEASHTQSLRLQQIIQEETNITQVADPLGGAYYVESLTSQVEAAAVKLLEEVERLGGYRHAHEFIRARIESSAQAWRDQIDRNQRFVVGINKYVTDDVQKVEKFKVSLASEHESVRRIQALRAERDGPRWELAMAMVDKAVARFARGENDHTLIPAMVAASHADATTGELMAVLKRHLGWHAPV
ncbi:MAG: acyl-CoA mutase large subunit family protein [Thermaerobacter sp.]|nr:acyl-CoA mutase large subunit family protein [Thermaerobacter sp.]